jgi:hypothetical protein
MGDTDDTGDTISNADAPERNLSGVDALFVLSPEKMRLPTNRPEEVSPASPVTPRGKQSAFSHVSLELALW